MQSYFEVFLCDGSGCFQRLGSGWSTTQAELGWTVPACLREGSYLTRVQVFESTTGTWDGMPSAPFKLGPSPHACIWDAWVDYSELRQGFYQQIRWTSQNQAGVALSVHKQSGNSWVPMDMRPYGGGADGWVFSANTNIQSAQWLVPQTFPPGWYAFWVKTWNSAGATQERYTRNAFNVLPQVRISAVTASPAQVDAGTQMTVSWSSTSQDGYTLERCRADGSGCQRIAGARPSTATSVAWTVPESLPPGQYRMKVTLTDSANGSAVGLSDVFTRRGAVVSFVGADSHLDEAVGTAEVLVQVTTSDGAPTGAPVSASYTTRDGTAMAGSDYRAASGSVSIPAGAASGSTTPVRVPILEDPLDEPQEFFELHLTGASGAGLGSRTLHYVNILDNDERPNHAMFVLQSVPSQVRPGQSFPVSVTIRNTGTNTWTPEGRYALGAQNPDTAPYTWTIGRAPVPAAIAPDTNVTFQFTATAPTTPGTYPFQWRMVQDGVEWFGAATPSVNVLVSDVEPVVWTNAVNVSVSGNSLTKTGTAGWTGGAVSTKTLSANGYVEFTVTPPGTHRVLGLGNGDTNQDVSDVEFGLLLADGGTLAVFERGSYVASFGVPAAGERLRIAVVDGKVRYYRNGQQFHESATAPTFPLRVDTSLNEVGATVSDVMLSGPWQEPGSEPIVWMNAVNVSVSGDSITKIGTTGWNGGAVSTKTLSGSGSVEFVVGPRGTHRAFGLGSGDPNQHLADIEDRKRGA